jgi:pimeloyl-ACP methyl ester carboxylesterase
MDAQPHLHASDLRGAAKLVVDAVVQTTSLVEGMHLNISRAPWPLGPGLEGRTSGITGLVYRSIRDITGLIGSGIDSLLVPLTELLAAPGSSKERETVVAALNGVLGDHLEASGNPLAIRMSLRRDGRPLRLERAALAAQIPNADGKLLVLVHGLCMNDLQWLRQDHDHGAALARDFGGSVLYLHYNSGRHVSANGREFAQLLETLLREWPVQITELSLLGHSMGGLVARSACHYAQQAGLAWPARLRRLMFLGTPHHGAPLERHGNKLQTFVANLSPYVAPLARLGMLRSAGVTDLRHGNLLDQDWGDHGRFDRADDRRALVPLPPVPCYAAAATLGRERGDGQDRWLADGLVPVWSALGEHRDPVRDLGLPPQRRWTGHEMNHWDLLNHPEVYARLAAWFGEAAA